MIRFASALPFLTLLVPAPLAAQAARDFQLPPAATPAPDTRVQGPVDTDAPVPIRPRVIETARPTAQAPAPAPAPAPTPAPAPSAGAATAIVLPSPSPGRPAAARGTPAHAAPAQAAPMVGPTLAPPLAAPAAGAGLALPRPSPAPTIAASPPAKPLGQPSPWRWLALAGAAIATGAGLFLWRRRRPIADAPPAIVLPNVPAPAASPGEALAIGVEAMRMDRSVLNATVGYRVTIRNRTAQALSGVAVEADLVSASRDRPTEEQLASPEQALTPRHAVDRLAPGQSLRFEGQVRLPLSEASAVWQGRVGLLVPLLRVRATAVEATPVATTLVIGRSQGQAARPQPFRLDEPPRSYAPLAQRVLDAAPIRA